ncbi:hypothetical protein SAMN04488128_105492 [Chitinophaga eiseniae]|uniref:Uncharacterized protein n=1 Tax=Chitinophaga eiseniae TaxID=634771 RepID=A0A1T4TNB9_9BACT|nr:hypothetical protein [Chitinophaga eiseniae]SKA41699.1 hypothetical protein SAMN04488128_105492 [Chitinophaga eiseniae]
MNTNLNDVIKLDTVGVTGMDHIHLLVSGELMKTHMKASPIEPNKDMLVTQDESGHVMILSIGTDNKLRLIRFSNGSADGYEILDLMANFEGYEKAVAFDLSENHNKTISIAMALTRKQEVYTDIFLAENISRDIDAAKFRGSCKKVSGIDTAFVADNIHMSTTDEKDESPMVVIAGKKGEAEYYYEVNNADLTATAASLPEAANKITQLEVGLMSGKKAKFFLYPQNKTTTLTCLVHNHGKSVHHEKAFDFSPNNPDIPKRYQHATYKCMAVAAGLKTKGKSLSSDLYVGTDQGVFLFKRGQIEAGFRVVTDTIQDVHQLYVVEDEHNISVWAIGGTGKTANALYYIHGEKVGEEYQWDKAYGFAKGITHVAPIRNEKKRSNELYLLDQQDNLIHCWQDPKSGVWNQRTINIKKDAYLIDLNSFVTHIKLTDEYGGILAKTKFRLTSSEWTYVNINGKIYSIDENSPAEIETDELGSINIIQLTEHIAVPVFHLEADFLKKTINIFPNGKILNGLSGIKSGDELRAAIGSGKKSVEGDLNDTVDSLKRLMGMTAVKRSEGCVFVSLSDSKEKVEKKLNLAHLSDGFVIGMSFENDSWQSHTGEAGIMEVSVVPDFILATVGDGFRYIEESIGQAKDAVRFVVKKVNEALEFCVTIGGKVLTLMLDTALKVFKAINWILKKIGIDLDEIMRWLGHVLSLDAIWKSHKIIAKLIENGAAHYIRFLEHKVEDLKELIGQSFDSVKEKVEGVLLSEKLPETAKTRLDQSSSLKSPLNSAAGSWIFSQIFNNDLLGGGIVAVINKDTGSEQYVHFIKKVAGIVDNLIPKLLKVFRDVGNILALDINSAFNLVHDVLDLLLDPMKALILEALDLLKELMKDISSALTSTVQIPFLNKMYNFFAALITDADKKADKKLTAAEAIAFIIAIPFTYASKILTGKAPFEDGDHNMTSTKYFEELFRGKEEELYPVAGCDNPAMCYSQIGGGFASIAAIPGHVISLMLFKAKKTDHKNLLDLLSFVLSFSTPPLTYPVRKDNQDIVAYNFKRSTWVLSFIKTIVSARIPEPSVSAGVSALFDGVIFPFALAADVIEKEDSLTFMQDILSNVGGALKNGSVAAGQLEFAYVAAGLPLLGAGIGFLQSTTTGDIHQLINLI